MVELTDKYIRKDNIVLREIAGETLLVPISEDLADLERLFALNEVGGLIWKSLDSESNLKCIASAVLAKFDSDKETVENDLKDLIAQFLDAGLIEQKQ